MKKNKNNQLASLVHELKKASAVHDVSLWKKMALELEKPTRQRRVVNIYKLTKYTNENDVVLVPGKVLGTGMLGHKVNVAACSFSDEAQEKIISKGGKVLSILDLIKSNPKGEKIKIIG